MFNTLPEKFRSFGLSADIRTLLLLRKAMERGLIATLGDIFAVLKGIIVKDPKQIGPFTQAFYDYFLNIDIKKGEKLNDAIARSEAFKDWKTNYFEKNEADISLENLVEKFLDEIHLTSYDIQKIINGNDILANDDPNMADNQQQANAERNLQQMADYTNQTLEELLERMRKVMEQQNSKHSGGSHWIGTGGISPYGHSGAAKGGIRVGGSGGGKMARAVMNDKNFYPIDIDKNINDDNVDAALAMLKGIFEDSANDVLDVPSTIQEGLKRGGLFLPEIKNIHQQKLQVILLIDNGGYSMLGYVKAIRQLFNKMKTRFAHDLETFYFHNTIYEEVFADAYRSQSVKIEKILSKDPNYRIFIIGDASMAPYELTRTSVDTYLKLTQKFKKIAWLNPEPLEYWPHTHTIKAIKSLIPMFPMSPRGIEKAVTEMNKIKI